MTESDTVDEQTRQQGFLAIYTRAFEFWIQL